MEIKLFLTALASLLLSFGHVASAHPHGAPTTTCDSMFPQHKREAQKSQCPYSTKPERTEIWSNMSLTMTLQPLESTPNVDHFNGYMIMAFDKNSPVAAIGTFQVPVESSHTIDCHGGFNNAATHSSKAHKTSVQLTWTPPEDFEGEVIFKTTYVESKKVYWVKVISEVIKVKLASRTETYPSVVFREEIIDPPCWTSYVSLWAIYSLIVILFAGGLAVTIAIRSSRRRSKKLYSTLQETVVSS